MAGLHVIQPARPPRVRPAEPLPLGRPAPPRPPGGVGRSFVRPQPVGNIARDRSQPFPAVRDRRRADRFGRPQQRPLYVLLARRLFPEVARQSLQVAA